MVLYDKLRTTKNGVVVAQVENSGKLCGKCRVDLPPNKIRDVKVLTAVVTCPSCGRILFYK
jgi:predicted  nucleic acid-binding Zn-ribbon protein